MELRNRTERRVDANDNSTIEERASKNQESSEGNAVNKTSYVVFFALLVRIRFICLKVTKLSESTFNLLAIVFNKSMIQCHLN